ncbi:unnamed protein product, partial [Laminaria digitata]
QEAVEFPEQHAYEFRLMGGQIIKLQPDGSFYVDNTKCAGDSFMGAHLC